MVGRWPGTQEMAGSIYLAAHDVKVTVRDGFARTEVVETFTNDSESVLEGRYTFELPAGASISRLALWVGDELIEGEIVERQRAERVYAAIVDTARRDPALLTREAGNAVMLRVFPIPPRGSRRVLVAYDQVLPAADGRVHCSVPLGAVDDPSHLERVSVTIDAREQRAVLEHLRVSMPRALVTEDGSSTTIRLAARAFARDERLDVSYAAAPANVSVFDPEGAEGELLAVAERSAGALDARYFALRLRTPQVTAAHHPARDRLIVVDRSADRTAEDLARARATLDAVTARLSAEERFAVLACDTACEAFPARGLAVSSPANRSAAAAWLARQRPAGALDVVGMLERAAERATPGAQLVVLGALEPSAGELEPSVVAARVEQVVARARVTLERPAPGAPLVEALFAPHPASLRLELPQGFEAAPGELTGVVLAGERVVFGRLAGEVAGDVAVSWIVEGRTLHERVPLVPAAGNNPLVPRQWANAQMQALEATSAAAPRADLVAFSRRHQVVSRHTALLVLENEPMFERFGIARTQGHAGALANAAPRVELAPSSVVEAAGDPLDGLGPPAEELAASPPARLLPLHRPRPVLSRMGASTVSGRLPPEVIQRIIRLRFGRLRSCYQDGLRRDPELAGRVVTRFIIARDGSVAGVRSEEGTDLADPEVVDCVRREFGAMTFPIPEGGIVTVTYPLRLSPEGAAAAPEVPVPARWPSAASVDGPPRAPVEPLRAKVAAGNESWRLCTRLRAPRWTRVSLAGLPREEAERALGYRFRAGCFREAIVGALQADSLPAAERAQLVAEASAAEGLSAHVATALASLVVARPRDFALQVRAARAYDSAGDLPRSCAHWRAARRLDPLSDLAERGLVRCLALGGDTVAAAREARSDQLVREVLAAPDAAPGPELASSLDAFTAHLECTPNTGRCPDLVLVTPEGRVVSPWTSPHAGAGWVRSYDLSVGRTRLLLVGGERSARGTLHLRAHGEVRTLPVVGTDVTAAFIDYCVESGCPAP